MQETDKTIGKCKTCGKDAAPLSRFCSPQCLAIAVDAMRSRMEHVPGFGTVAEENCECAGCGKKLFRNVNKRNPKCEDCKKTYSIHAVQKRGQ